MGPGVGVISFGLVYIFVVVVFIPKRNTNLFLFFTGKIYYRLEMNTRTTAGEKRKEKKLHEKNINGLGMCFRFCCCFCFCLFVLFCFFTLSLSRGVMSYRVLSQGITSQLEMSRE